MDDGSSCGDLNEAAEVPGLGDVEEDDVLESESTHPGQYAPTTSTESQAHPMPKCKTTMATQAHRLSTCVDTKTVTVLDDVAIRCNRAIYIGSVTLAHDVLQSLANGKDPVRFWETKVIDKAFALATVGYKPYAVSKGLVDRLTEARDACFSDSELLDRKGIGIVLNDQAPTYAANALTSLKVHTAKRVARLVHLRAKLPQDEFDALTSEEKKIRSEEIKLACADAMVPPYDQSRHSELDDLVDGVRATIGIDDWAWYKPIPPKSSSNAVPQRRELLDAIEAGPMVVVKAMQKINLELADAKAKTFAIVPVRISFVPRFVHIGQDALFDMGLLDTGDVNQATLRKRMRKESEVHSVGSKTLDIEIKTIANRIRTIDKKLNKLDKTAKDYTSLKAEREILADELKKLKKGREFVLCPTKLELKRLRESHSAEDQRLKQQRIEDQLAVRAKTRPKPTKVDVEASKLVSEQRKRAREEEIGILQAQIDAEDTGGAAALQAKSDAFTQVLHLPPKLVRAFGSDGSKKVSFADGLSTDGYSIRLNINKRAPEVPGDHTDTPPPSKKAKMSAATPTRVPKRGLIGVEEMAKLVKGASNGRIVKGDINDGMMRDRSPKEQNDRMNELLNVSFGGDCPFHIVGCDPGKRELAVLVDSDIFGLQPSLRPQDRPLMLRYTSDERKHDYTPGCYGLRKKQRIDPSKENRVKRASKAAEYRTQVATPVYVLDAEHSIVADAHKTKTAVPSVKSPHLDRFGAWVEARKRISPTVRPFYEHLMQRKLRWKKHIERERSLAMFIQRIKEFEKKVGKQLVIAWGGWGKSAGRPGQACNKGSAPALGVGLLNAVAQHFLVVVVPEAYSTKTCYHCGGHATRCVEVEEARRPKRDECAATRLAKALATAGDNEDEQVAAQKRYDKTVSHRPQVRGIRCCESCGLRISRDKNGGANIGLNGKRFLLGAGAFKTLSTRQTALQHASILMDE